MIIGRGPLCQDRRVAAKPAEPDDLNAAIMARAVIDHLTAAVPDEIGGDDGSVVLPGGEAGPSVLTDAALFHRDSTK